MIFITSIISFAATNLDDIFMLMIFLARAESKSDRLRVLAGQLLGIGLLTAVSLAGAGAVSLISDKLTALLGIIPIMLGVREWLASRKGGDSDGGIQSKLRVRDVMLVTIAGGGDNLGVYIPLFAGFNVSEKCIAAAVFAVMTVVWWFAAERLSLLPAVTSVIRRYRRILVPAVFIILGISIIADGVVEW